MVMNTPILFPPPSSIFVTTMSFITFGSLANAGISELRGKHLQYSKFWNSNPQAQPNKNKMIKLSSRVGMASLYVPAFLFGLASFFIFPYGFDDHHLRFFLLRLALTIHFLKRVLEIPKQPTMLRMKESFLSGIVLATTSVLFVHKFGDSGVVLDSAIPISISYFISTVTMIYAQYLSGEVPEPSMDLKYVGIGLFLLGIGGNFYHHYILATLRKEGEKEYKIPRGGLFNLVICPHYLFEVLIFVGVSCIAQTLYSLAFTGGTALYLTGRSYATKKWYLSKFEDFPKDVKALLPFIF